MFEPWDVSITADSSLKPLKAFCVWAVFPAGAIFYLGLDRAAHVTAAVNLTLICLLFCRVQRGSSRCTGEAHPSRRSGFLAWKRRFKGSLSRGRRTQGGLDAACMPHESPSTSGNSSHGSYLMVPGRYQTRRREKYRFSVILTHTLSICGCLIGLLSLYQCTGSGLKSIHRQLFCRSTGNSGYDQSPSMRVRPQWAHRETRTGQTQALTWQRDRKTYKKHQFYLRMSFFRPTRSTPLELRHHFTTGL